MAAGGRISRCHLLDVVNVLGGNLGDIGDRFQENFHVVLVNAREERKSGEKLVRLWAIYRQNLEKQNLSV